VGFFSARLNVVLVTRGIHVEYAPVQPMAPVAFWFTCSCVTCAGSYPRTLLHLLIFAATLRACSAFAPTILVRFTTGRESGAQEQGLGLSRGAFSRVSSHSCSGGRAVDTLGHGQQARLSLTGGGTSIGRRQTLARMCTTKREESAESADANDANARNLDGNPVPNEVALNE
jgi:hypothetical protein